MNAPFDPYYFWLGIPPEDQPPNHYRLLGLATYESNPEVISQAADRQMTFVQMHKVGAHAEHSQKLLNELAVARRVLLVADKKTAYDVELKRKLGAANDAREPLDPFGRSAALSGLPMSMLPGRPTAGQAVVVRRTSGRGAANYLLMAAGALCGVVVMLMLVFAFAGPRRKTPTAAVSVSTSAVASPAIQSPVGAPSSKSESPPAAAAPASPTPATAPTASAPINPPLNPLPAPDAPVALSTSATSSTSSTPAASSPPPSPPPAPEPPPLPVGQWVDLMPFINVREHALSPRWEVRDGAIGVFDNAKWDRLAIPVIPEGSYELEVKLRRPHGEDAVELYLPVGTGAVVAAFSHGKGQSHRLQALQEALPGAEQTTPGNMKSGPEVTVNAAVVVNGDDAQISVRLDRQRVMRWSGAIAALPKNVASKDRPACLSFQLFEEPASLTSVRIRIDAGPARLGTR